MNQYIEGRPVEVALLDDLDVFEPMTKGELLRRMFPGQVSMFMMSVLDPVDLRGFVVPHKGE